MIDKTSFYVNPTQSEENVQLLRALLGIVENVVEQYKAGLDSKTISCTSIIKDIIESINNGSDFNSYFRGSSLVGTNAEFFGKSSNYEICMRTNGFVAKELYDVAALKLITQHNGLIEKVLKEYRIVRANDELREFMTLSTESNSQSVESSHNNGKRISEVKDSTEFELVNYRSDLMESMTIKIVKKDKNEKEYV